MKILVNGYNLRGKPTGIANVIISFINSLCEKTDIQVEILACVDIPECITERFILTNNLVITKSGLKKSMLWFFISLPFFVNRSNADLFWSPTPILPFFISKKIKKLISVNDFVSKDFKETMTTKGRLITSLCEPKTIRSADYLWCISEYTKNRLLEIYPEVAEKKIFIGCAPDTIFSKIKLSETERNIFLHSFNIDKKYLFFVGSLEPRKNLSFLLQVFKQYHKTNDYKLVVVGARKWGETNIKEIVSEEEFPAKDVVFMDYISEIDLVKLYNFAECYVSTSLNEGFGLPQTEAMKCGCPVVTAHNSAMTEVAEGAGIAVKNWNIFDWCTAIEYAINNKNAIIDMQFLKVADYNWDFITARFIKFIGA